MDPFDRACDEFAALARVATDRELAETLEGAPTCTLATATGARH